MLYGLTSVREPRSFYERVQIVLALLNWEGAPATVHDLHRQTRLPAETLSRHLSILRQSGWLGDDDRFYRLTSRSRILAFVLRIVAQPWEEGDTGAVIGQIFAAASSQELGLGPILLFGSVVSTIEESVSRLERALELEETERVRSRLRETRRNTRVARKALEIRESGVMDDNYNEVQRMHEAISHLIDLSAKLEKHYTGLLERDLLASGQVTLGDIREWAARTDDAVLGDLMTDYIQLSIPQPWFTPSGELLASEQEVAHSKPRQRYRKAPKPQQFVEAHPNTFIDDTTKALLDVQGRLRALVRQYGTLPLVDWANQDTWPTALLHLMAALDPSLNSSATRIYLSLDQQGRYVMPAQGAFKQLTEGSLHGEKVDA